MLRDRIEEWRLRNDTSYDELILVTNDGRGWLTWLQNDHTEPMLRPLGMTMTYQGHTYSPIIQVPFFIEVHNKTRERAVRLGRRLAKEDADREVLRRTATRPEVGR
jgi:hypothetical protein